MFILLGLIGSLIGIGFAFVLDNLIKIIKLLKEIRDKL